MRLERIQQRSAKPLDDGENSNNHGYGEDDQVCKRQIVGALQPLRLVKLHPSIHFPSIYILGESTVKSSICKPTNKVI